MSVESYLVKEVSDLFWVENLSKFFYVIFILSANHFIFLTILTTKGLRTIELADGWHIDHPDGGYVNHHCSPTCVINKTDGTIVAYRDIKKGEVINFNYMVNESEIDSAFHCKCGAHSCQGYIGTKNSQVSFLENEVSPTAPAAVETTARTPKSKAGSGLTSDNSPSSVVMTATND